MNNFIFNASASYERIPRSDANFKEFLDKHSCIEYTTPHTPQFEPSCNKYLSGEPAYDDIGALRCWRPMEEEVNRLIHAWVFLIH